jgi:ABC-type nickel/cobalt efflux system permease component RcnA
MRAITWITIGGLACLNVYQCLQRPAPRSHDTAVDSSATHAHDVDPTEHIFQLLQGKSPPRPSIKPSFPTHPSIARAHTEVHRPLFPIKRSSLPDSAGDRLTRGRKLLAVSPPPTRSPTSTVPAGSKQLVHTRKHGHTTYTDSHAREPSRTQCVRIAVWMQRLRHC